MTVLQPAPCAGRPLVTEKTLHCRSTDGTPLALHQFTPSMRTAQNTPPTQPANAATLSINPGRLGILGVHAGGTLVLAAAMLLRNARQPRLAKQLVLVAPWLDDRSRTEGMGRVLTWTAEVNAWAWELYMDNVMARYGNVEEVVAPGRAANVAGLPRMYIDAGEFDHSLWDCARFVQRVRDAGGEARLHMYKGVPHAFEWEAPTAEVTMTAMNNRVDVFRNL
ncbi:Alpha/Beta hydrolase protein [Chaetomium tenue]|uniref:Alpha/Beta hydrolase protein n=1 Tax=Chaetomium tenue TaxID=1854479 RepID=A0ACB7NZT7_9PEZI|nr:Alpha/Beta hydrolase protein [Chaetomium globosum]